MSNINDPEMVCMSEMELGYRLTQARAEAVREFADKLKAQVKRFPPMDTIHVAPLLIDTLLKEYEKENE